MTLTIEIAPEVETAIAAKAARLGVPVERYAAGVLQRDAQSNSTPHEYSSRAAAIKAARGSLKDLPGSVDDFLRERHECDNL